MERFLCLDIGDKRIGIAVSDPFNSYALPVETYHRKNLKTDLEKVKEYVISRGITAIVCGLPVNFDGSESVQTQKAKYFIDRLTQSLGLQVFCVDERCTTCDAEEVLISQGKTREQRKGIIDSLASANILERFLTQRNLELKK